MKVFCIQYSGEYCSGVAMIVAESRIHAIEILEQEKHADEHETAEIKGASAPDAGIVFDCEDNAWRQRP